MVFEEVQTDLEAQGYEVQTVILPASGVNAPHRRDRVWFIAKNTNDIRWNSKEWKEEASNGEQRKFSTGDNERFYTSTTSTNNNNKGLQGSENIGGIGESREKSNEQSSRFFRTNWEEFPAVSPICYGDDGLSDRLDSITFPKWRTESIQAGGNAIVPQVAYQIFKSIEQFELTNQQFK